MSEVAEKKIDLRVIAPTMATDKSPYKFRQSVDMVIMRCTTGDMGILPGRVPVSAVLDTGILRIFTDKESKMVVMDGIAHVCDDVVTILSNSVITPEEINKEEVADKLKEYQKLHDSAQDSNEINLYKKNIRQCQLQLDIVGK